MSATSITNRNYHEIFGLPNYVLMAIDSRDQNFRYVRDFIDLSDKLRDVNFGLLTNPAGIGRFRQGFGPISRFPVVIFLSRGKEKYRLYDSRKKEEIEEIILRQGLI